MSAPHEEDRLLDHNYDGIQEFDNPMPRWWVWIFWATIIFSVVYVADPTGSIRGPGRVREYENQLAEAAERWPAPTTTIDEAGLQALVSNPQVLAAGREVFNANCAVCHRPDGGGLIGPNLTDEYWLHGGKLTDIHKTIVEGVLTVGMPAWGRVLQPTQVNAVTAYVASLAGSNPPNPKPPQGDTISGR